MLTVNRKRPSWLISTQHGAVWSSANGDAPIEVSVPLRDAEGRDGPGASSDVVAFETNSWLGIGRPELAAERAEALRGERRARGGGQTPVEPTLKLSIWEVPTWVRPGSCRSS